MITFSNLVKASNLEEAYQLNQKKNNAILAGGMWIRMGNRKLGTMIDLSMLSLDQIEENDEEYKIGAMVTLRQLETNESLEQYTQGALRNSIKDIVGVQFRNMATIGGSIYSRFGFSDLLTMFLVMDCDVLLYKEGRVSLQEYAAREHHDRDILTHLLVRKKAGRFVYQSVRNAATDFPVLSHATVKWEDGTVDMAIGARPGKAILKKDVKDPAAVAKQVNTGTNTRGTKSYRKHLVEVLSTRAMEGLEG